MKESKKSNTADGTSGLTTKGECFVMMPISDPDGYEKGHFERVYQDIFIPAIEKAGYKPFRADDDKATNLIHLEILRKLLDCPIALCDLSTRNPNVLFELGIRQAFDKPVVLIQEIGTPKIFDTSSIRCLDYRKERLYHEVLEDQESIYQAILQTVKNWEKGTSINSIIRLLSLTKPASPEELNESKQDPVLQLIMSELIELKSELRKSRSLSFREDDYDREYRFARRRYSAIRSAFEEMMRKGEVNSDILKDLRNQIDNYMHLSRGKNPEFREIADRFIELYKEINEYLNRSEPMDA